MLAVEDRFMIKDVSRKGVSISEIARRTGHDRKTVRKIATGPVVPTRAPAPPRVHKLDPFIPYLERRVAEGVVNANKLLAELREQGYPGGKTRLKDWLHTRRPRSPVAPVICFETAPGEQAQVDFAHFGTIHHRGRAHRLSAFLMTLGWSRMLFVCFVTSCDWVAFLRGHLAAFQAFGGVPRTIVHDNLKSAVLHRRGGRVHFHPRYLDFADYYGFTPRPCQPYRARTKGKVERAVQYLRGNFWPGIQYDGLDHLNQQVQHWLATVANVRIHATTGVTPISRLVDEGLPPLGTRPPYDITPILLRQASRDGWVRYAGTAYAIPLTYAGQAVVLKLTDQDEVVITTPQGRAVARYTQARRTGGRVGWPTEGLRGPDRPPQAATTPPPQVEQRSLQDYETVREEP